MHKIIILFLCSAILKNPSSLQTEICGPICSNLNNVTWPVTKSKTLSQPPCVNEAKEFVYRECLNGTWGADPRCSYVQFEKPPQCPENFISQDDLKICYNISSQKTKFPPKCQFKDVLPFDSYKILIDNKGPVWMPVARYFDRGFDLLRWTEASSLYKTAFDSEYIDYMKSTSRGTSCLVYYNSTYIREVSCDEEHRSICAYNYFTQMSNQICLSGASCYQSDFSTTSTCFCVGSSQGLYPKAELLKPYQNNIYQKLIPGNFSIALEKNSNGSYFWTNSQTAINYSYWAKNVTFDTNHKYGALSNLGWVLTEKPLPFCLFEKVSDKTKPTLDLTFEHTFELKITGYDSLKRINGEVLVYCFTDANSSDLLYRYSYLTSYKTDGSLYYYFMPLEDGPGYYWCEAIRYMDMEVVESNRYFLRQKESFPYEYVAYITVNLPETDLRGNNILKWLNETLHSSFDSFLYRLKNHYTTRLMEITSIMSKDISIIIHLTSKTSERKEIDNAIEEYYAMKMQIEQHFEEMKNPGIKLNKFSAVDFCASETTDNNSLHWPDTLSGKTAFPEEFCFTKNGIRLIRQCLDDFISGATWFEEESQDCEIFPKSSITDKLSNLAKSNSKEILETLLLLSESPSEFYPIDVYLVGDIFDNLIGSLDPATFEIFGKIIGNLMEINASVLIESQHKMRATDRILDKINHIVANHPYSIQYSSRTFHLIKSPIDGILIPKWGQISPLPSLSKSYTVSNISDMGPESAIWINRKSQDTIKTDTALAIMVFFKDSFFVEKNSNKSYNTIFNIKILELNTLTDPVRVYQSVKNLSMECLFWSFDITTSNDGFWEKDDSGTDFENFSVCRFWKQGYYALNLELHDDSDNVTESLVDILENSISAAEAMSSLCNISKKYDDFRPVDIFLVGKIMEKVYTSKDIDLEVLAITVNNLLKIQKETLWRSQIEWRSTDLILDCIDKITLHHNDQNSIRIITDNFMIFILEDFNWLILIEDDRTIQSLVLDGDIKIEDIINDQKLNSAISLSPKLTTQLEKNEKIVLTVFLNDAFFNEKKSKNKRVSHIFGVILPETIEYEWPISIFYKPSQTHRQEECVHWHYNRDVSGYWYEEEPAKGENSLIRCDFWHTTHFALLVMDHDKLKDDKILELITTITCALSLISLCGIVFTAILFKKWRRNIGNQILLNIVFAMIFQTIFFYISSTIDPKNSTLCTVIGVFLHYSTISEFCWMLMAACLQFKRFVRVLAGPPQNILLKSCLVGWILPLLPVISVFLSDQESYVNNNKGMCYPSGFGLYFGVWLPISLVLVLNFSLFVCIIYSVVHNKSECVNNGNNEAIFQWRLGILLFFMLGLTWVFAFLAEFHFGVIFVYLFCLTATLQGVVLFFFFIIFNINSKYLYKQSFKKCFNNKN